MTPVRVVLACCCAVALAAGEAVVLPRPLAVADETQRAALREVKGAIERLALTDDLDARADSLADAVNGVARFREPGAYLVEYGDRLVIVALGDATWEPAENPTATRLLQRNASLGARVRARDHLEKKLTSLAGLETGGRLDREIHGAAAARAGEEDLRRKVSLARLYRAYVLYDIDVDEEARRVRAILVTAPAFLQEVERLGHRCRRVADLDVAIADFEGLARRGFAPPTDRVLLVDPAGKVAFVGTGSCVVRQHQDLDQAARLLDEARRAARGRAQLGLVSLLQTDCRLPPGGDADLDGPGQAVLTALQDGEPTCRDLSMVIGTSWRDLLDTLKTRPEWQDFTAGRIPPAVEHRSFDAPDGGYCVAVAVYRPEVVFPEVDDGPVAAPPQAPPPAQAPVRPDAAVERGPSGRVTEEEDL